VWLNYFKTKIN